MQDLKWPKTKPTINLINLKNVEKKKPKGRKENIKGSIDKKAGKGRKEKKRKEIGWRKENNPI